MTSSTQEGQEVKLELRITPPDSCVVHELEGDIVSINQHPTDEGFCCEVVYRTPEGNEKPVREVKTAEYDCPARVFADHRCVPTVTGTEGNSCLVTTFPPSRDRATDLLKDLSEVAENLAVRRISDNGISELSDAVDHLERTVDLSVLTEKQREAVQLAADRGYYDQPRETDLTELAEELEITQSALSQRLRSAETKLSGQLFVQEPRRQEPDDCCR